MAYMCAGRMTSWPSCPAATSSTPSAWPPGSTRPPTAHSAGDQHNIFILFYILKFSNYCKYIVPTLYSQENLPNRRSGVGGDAEAEDQSQEERRRLGDASQFNVRIVVVIVHIYHLWSLLWCVCVRKWRGSPKAFLNNFFKYKFINNTIQLKYKRFESLVMAFIWVSKPAVVFMLLGWGLSWLCWNV